MSKMRDGAPIVLIVDDDAMMVRVIEMGLKETGYGVLSAATAQSGLQSALDKHPDLILLDYNLPDGDGVSILRQLRQDEWGSSVPVIMASNVYDIDIVNAVMTLGVQDYVLKVDVNVEQIVALIGKYLPLPSSQDGQR